MYIYLSIVTKMYTSQQRLRLTDLLTLNRHIKRVVKKISVSKWLINIDLLKSQWLKNVSKIISFRIRDIR